MSMPFAVQHSVLSAEALATEVRRRYALGTQGTCEFYAQGLNDTYLVSAGEDRWVIRVYRYAWRTDKEILFELELLEHLKSCGAPVATPRRTSAGDLFFRVAAPEGERQVALFEFAPGEMIRNADHTRESAQAYGEGAGRIHTGMDSFSTLHQRPPLDVNHLLHTPLRALESRLSPRPQDWQYVQDCAERLMKTLQDFDAQGLTTGLCHGDFHGGNAHRNEEGSYTFFDFDCGGPGWRAYDVAVFRWALERLPPATEETETIWQAFLTGYRSQHELSDADEAAVPIFVTIREIWLMGLHASLLGDFGVAMMSNSYFDRELKLLRQWDETRLKTLPSHNS